MIAKIGRPLFLVLAVICGFTTLLQVLYYESPIDILDTFLFAALTLNFLAFAFGWYRD